MRTANVALQVCELPALKILVGDPLVELVESGILAATHGSVEVHVADQPGRVQLLITADPK